MKKLLLLLSVISMSAYATSVPEDCMPEEDSAKKISAKIASQNNNKCPKRTYKNHFASAKNLADVKRIAAEKFKSMGLGVNFEAGRSYYGKWESIPDNDPTELARVKKIANAAIHALSLYPKDAFHKMGLRTVKIVKDLSVNSQQRDAMPDNYSHSIVFGSNREIHCLPLYEASMHHELFHQMEGTVHKNKYHKDPRWRALNKPGTNYGFGGASAYGLENFSNKEHPRAGFVTEYSSYGEEEDRAEIFGRMMTIGYASRLDGWTYVDPVLKNKRHYIMDHFKNRVSPNMNHDYFDKLTSP